MAKLVAVRFHQRLPGEAESLYRRALEVFQRVRGANDQEVAGVLANYGWVLRPNRPKGRGEETGSARAILATPPGDRGRFSVDVSDLFSPRQ
jgi:hypothetical protein